MRGVEIMIQITGIKVGGHSIPVPTGLSELVHHSNAWSVPDKKRINENYDRHVKFENGKLTTVLTRKSKLKKEA